RSDSSRRRTQVSGTRRLDPKPSRSTEMGNFDDLLCFLPPSCDLPASRRRGLLAPLLAAVMLAMARAVAQASRIDPSQTVITLPDAIKWVPWSGLPPHSGEMASLYGGLDQHGPHLVLFKGSPRIHPPAIGSRWCCPEPGG